MDNEPSISDLANASQSAYRDTAPEGYNRLDELSSPDISTYQHKENPHFIIAHRGTDVGATKVSKQLKADAAILFGNRNQDKLHKERTKRTEMIVKELKSKSPESDIYLSAHSLGGSTAHHAMVKSPTVRENVKALHTFNAGSSPLQGKGLAKSNKAYKVIADKSTHHSVQGDELSRSVSTNLIGKQIKYKAPKEKPSIGRAILKLAKPYLEKSPLGKLLHFGGDRILNTLSSHSLSNFTD